MASNEPKPADQQSEPGHPVLQAAEHIAGVGVGVAVGGAAGTVLGAVGGPAGIAAGAVAGALIGGLAGEAAAELLDEGLDGHWQKYLHDRGHAPADHERYQAACQAGWRARRLSRGKSFDEVETELRQQWESRGANAGLSWDTVKPIVRNGWDAAAPSQPPPAQSPAQPE